MYVALKMFAQRTAETGEVRRPTIVVLSDGNDTKSLVPFDDVLELARRSGVCVYTISLSAPAPGTPAPIAPLLSRGDYEMRVLASESGARAFRPARISERRDVYGAIVTELSRQYTLGYRSSNASRDGAFRRVAVQVPSRAGAQARTRSGYFAPRDGHAAIGGGDPQ